MAEPVPISGGPEEAKIRSLWGVALLPLITFGIYHYVWYYKINRELRDLGRKRGVDLGDSPGTSLVAVTIGAIIIVPTIMSWIGTYKRIKTAQQLLGVNPNDQMDGWVVVLGYAIIGPLAWAYQQDGLNKVWDIDSGRVPAGIPANAQQMYQAAPAVGVPQPPVPPAPPVSPAPPASPAPGIIPEAPAPAPPPAADAPPSPEPPAPPAQ